jgi:hypothetical protein
MPMPMPMPMPVPMPVPVPVPVPRMTPLRSDLWFMPPFPDREAHNRTLRGVLLHTTPHHAGANLAANASRST